MEMSINLNSSPPPRFWLPTDSSSLLFSLSNFSSLVLVLSEHFVAPISTMLNEVVLAMPNLAFFAFDFGDFLFPRQLSI